MPVGLSETGVTPESRLQMDSKEPPKNLGALTSAGDGISKPTQSSGVGTPGAEAPAPPTPEAAAPQLMFSQEAESWMGFHQDKVIQEKLKKKAQNIAYNAGRGAVGSTDMKQAAIELHVEQLNALAPELLKQNVPKPSRIWVIRRAFARRWGLACRRLVVKALDAMGRLITTPFMRGAASVPELYPSQGRSSADAMADAWDEIGRCLGDAILDTGQELLADGPDPRAS